MGAMFARRIYRDEFIYTLTMCGPGVRGPYQNTAQVEQDSKGSVSYILIDKYC